MFNIITETLLRKICDQNVHKSKGIILIDARFKSVLSRSITLTTLFKDADSSASFVTETQTRTYSLKFING